MLWPAAIFVDGVPVPLDRWRADLQIHHGRTSAFGDPAASTCQVVLLGVSQDFAQAFRVGLPLVVTVADDGGTPFHRYSGRVTDATLDADTLTVIATGKLSELGLYEIGHVNWPQELWSDRVERVFAEAGLSSLLVLQAGTVFDPILAPRDAFAAGPTTLGDTLAALAAMVGAAVTDLPDGRILVQQLSDRDVTAIDVAGHHGDIDPADVAYAPVWSQVLPEATAVTVTYTPGTTLPPRVGALTDNSPTVTGLSSTLDILPGMPVTGIGIPVDTFVQAVVTSSQITLSRPANIAATKDGVCHPGETKISEISDTSDLSIGMSVAAGGDLAGGTVITGLHDHEVDISPAAVGTHQGSFAFSAPGSATLTFAAEIAYVRHENEAAFAQFGERSVQIDTTFRDVEAADQRAAERLARVSSPRWNIPAAPILRGLELRVGYPVVLSGMPSSAPVTDWLALVEGWSETITGDEWAMELVLSDPLLSGYVFVWTLVPAAWAWNELDPGSSWYEAHSLEAITP